MPGITSTTTYSPTEILAVAGSEALALPVTLKGNVGMVLAKGDIIGTIAVGGKAVLCKQTEVKTQVAQAGVTVGVYDARPFAAGQGIKFGSVLGTIAAGGVDLTTNVLTLAAAIGTIDAGTSVKGVDGSEVAKGILGEDVDMTGVNDVISRVHVCGFFVEANLGGTKSSTLLAGIKTDLGARSSLNGVLIVPGA